MRAWIALLLSLQQATDDRKWPFPPQPLRDGHLQIFEDDPRGERALRAELWGSEIVPIDAEKVLFDVHQLRTVYYSRPRGEGDRSLRYDVTSESASCDGKQQQVHARGGVDLWGQDGTHLETAALELRFLDGQFATDQSFVWTRPGLVLTGRGLVADDRLRQMTIDRDGWVEVLGRPGDLADPGAPAAITRLSSKGPMTFREIEGGALYLISTTAGVTLEMVDAVGGAIVTCEETDFFVLPGTKQNAELEKVVARKNVRVRDSIRTEVDSETLEWLQAAETAHFTGSPLVRVARGKNLIRSRELRADRVRGVSTFTGSVEADLLSDEPQPRPIFLTSDELVTLEEAAVFTRMTATGNVHLTGLLEGQGESSIATCHEFRWNAGEQRGVLLGGPWARVDMGPHRLLAARIVVPGAGQMVLQGPKQARLLQEEVAGPPTAYAISCRGDLVVNTTSHRIKMVDRCTVFSKDSRMFAERIDVRLAADGKGIESIRAAERVEMRQGGSRVFGDRMTRTGEAFTLRGWPHVSVVQPEMWSKMAVVRYDPKTGKFEGSRGRERINIRIVEEKKP